MSASPPLSPHWLSTVPGKAAVAGVLGWAGENALYGPRYSQVWRGRRVPFLPVYAAGGGAVAALAPRLAGLPFPVRGAIYGATAMGIEFLGCQIDRRFFGARSWDYEGKDALAEKTGGCVDWKHSLLWAGIGLLAEKL